MSHMIAQKCRSVDQFTLSKCNARFLIRYSGRYVESGSRDVMTRLWPFLLCIYCTGPLSQLEKLNCTVL